MSEYKVSYKAQCIHFVSLSGNGVFPCFTVSNMYGKKRLVQCFIGYTYTTKLRSFADVDGVFSVFSVLNVHRVNRLTAFRSAVTPTIHSTTTSSPMLAFLPGLACNAF